MVGTPPSRYGYDNDPSMEIDEEAVRRWEENTGGKAVPERLMLLVSEDELEGVSSKRHSALQISSSSRTRKRFKIPVSHHRLHRCLQLISGLSNCKHIRTRFNPTPPLSELFYVDRTLIWSVKSRTGSGNSTPKIRLGNWPRKSAGSLAVT